MKFRALIIALVSGFFCLNVSVIAEDRAPQKLSIKVKDTKLRSSPKPWASSVAELRFGDVVTGIGGENGWIKVKTLSGAQGFVHPSAITDKKIVLTSRATASTKVDQSEVVLAGKGFNKQVEKDFAAKNPQLDFRKVDQISANKISDQELVQFMRNGKLSPSEGGNS